MSKPVVLLGAGASIDAGLPDAFGLTEIVYEALGRVDPTSAKLFGFVIAKLNVRSARKGASPFVRVNIEDVYDALKRVLNRDSDVLGEFVTSWEPLVETAKPRPNHIKIKRELESAVRISSDFRGHPKVRVDQNKLRSAVEELLGISAISQSDATYVLDKCLNVLCGILSPEERNDGYIIEFLQNVGNELECICTLNYDTLFEDAGKRIGHEFDYGLGNWNTKRVIKFRPSVSRLLKLHGSVNWLTRGQDEIVFEQPPDQWPRLSNAVIFGGQNEKLNPNGPFLSLRHELQRSLHNATTLAVIGYSFSDEHLNAMLRSWIAVKRKAKLIVVDPDGIQKASRVTGRIAAWTGSELRSDTVEFHEIKGGFAAKIGELSEALRTAPRPVGRDTEKRRTKSPTVRISDYGGGKSR